jgi:TonB family protein
MLDTLATHPTVQAIGQALVAFVWQGAIAGCVTAAVLVLLRAAAPQTRYVVGVVGLAVMMALPVMAFRRALPDARSSADLGTRGAAAIVVDATMPTPAEAEPSTGLTSMNAAAPAVPFTAIVALIWTCGVLVLTAALLRSWHHVRRLRRTSVAAAVGLVRATESLATRLGLARRVRVVESALVALPSVVGWLRPVVVLPASALAGLTPSQLEAIIAHELAHIRRGDYVVNAWQCIVETLLFYHPAVWWVSRQIRIERELCCDDLAAAVCGDRELYARALTALEEQRTRVPSLAMAASGGDLVTRVRRLVEPSRPSGPGWSGGFVMSVVMTVVAVSLSGSLFADNTAVAPTAASQERSALLVTVRDQQGGRVPGATVQVSLPQGPQLFQLITDPRGEARAQLGPGTYDLRISLSGFRASSVVGVNVSESQTAQLDIRLELGSLVETVMVRASRPPGIPKAMQAAPPDRPQTPADYFDRAKMYYQAGLLADAERMTARALELLREQTAPRRVTPPAAPPTGVEPRPQLPVRVGGDVREPRQLSAVTPVYPPDALAAGVEGTVIIEATIDRDGLVSEARVIRSVPLLDAAALEAVGKWRYTPTRLNNVAVPVLMTVTVTFELR